VSVYERGVVWVTEIDVPIRPIANVFKAHHRRRDAVRARRTVGVVLVPRSYLGAQHGERHGFACGAT